MHVGRGKSVPGPVKLELAVPEHMRGVTAEPVVADADTSEVAMTLTFSENEMGPFNMPLLIRGTTQQDGQPYTAETKLEALLDPEDLSGGR